MLGLWRTNSTSILHAHVVCRWCSSLPTVPEDDAELTGTVLDKSAGRHSVGRAQRALLTALIRPRPTRMNRFPRTFP
ncbi:hypothetical protein BD309DRAFT_548097 [Dichomitus squalens]|nr:hypothetical protein BD309DRAFT_548097 [Dichomitus squalens]